MDMFSLPVPLILCQQVIRVLCESDLPPTLKKLRLSLGGIEAAANSQRAKEHAEGVALVMRSKPQLEELDIIRYCPI